MQDLHSTIYLPRAEARSSSGRRQPVPDRTLGAQGQRPGGAINPRPRKTTVGRLNGRPFYGQAKGQLRPTCTSYTGCAHQPSGILESTAQIPVPTAPQAPYNNPRAKGASNLSPLRTFGPSGRQSSRPQGVSICRLPSIFFSKGVHHESGRNYELTYPLRQHHHSA